MNDKQHNKDQRAAYGEIVVKDCYKLNYWKNNFFNTIIDIGASLGIFTIYAHMRNPHAKIYSFEPCKEAFNYLKKDYHYLNNVTFINEALGDGTNLIFHDTKWFTSNLFYKKGENDQILDDSNSYSIKSETLLQMFKSKNISTIGNYYIKIDCEGGERFLLNNKESINILKKSQGSSIEVHFPPTREDHKNYQNFKTFPKWEIYNTWIYDNFDKTHNILYHCSSKHRGAGTFTMFIKEKSKEPI